MPRRQRRHHYIPEMHLANFSGYRFRRFAVFDKQFGKFAFVPVKTSARISNYYDLPGRTPEERLRFENQFQVIENEIAPILRRLISLPEGLVRVPAPTTRALSQYIALLHARVPARREPAFMQAVAMSRDLSVLGLDDPAAFVRDARSEGGYIGDPEDLRQQAEALADDLKAGRREIRLLSQVSLMGLDSADRLVQPMLAERKWSIVRTAAYPGFVLGDQPVTLLAPDTRILPAVGFGSPGVMVLVPLSPTTLLLIEDAPRSELVPISLWTPRGLAEPIWSAANKVAWMSARRYVWASSMKSVQAAAALIPDEHRRRSEW